MLSGRQGVEVVVSDVDLQSSVHWNLTHQMPPIPSWFRYGRRTEYTGIFGASFRGYPFREARSRK
jgi:hypothetical protein